MASFAQMIKRPTGDHENPAPNITFARADDNLDYLATLDFQVPLSRARFLSNASK